MEQPAQTPFRLSDQQPTNAQVGVLIGMGQTGVSRIRTGDRLPSISAMRRIERSLGWACGDQITWRERGNDAYAQEFNRRCAEKITELAENSPKDALSVGTD